VRLVPISRLNSLLVVTPQSKYLQDVQGWIERLDLGGTSPGRRIYVYDVQNGKAGDLASSLNRILSLADEGESTTVGPVGTAGGGSATAAVSPVAATRMPRTQSEPNNGASALDSGALKIVPNEENNSLLILATPSEFGVIESALERLDVLPRQVLIEASLAEVTLTDEMRYGVQWSYLGGDGPITLSESGNGGISQRFPGFSYLFTGREDIRAVLNAIESITNVNVISSPKLLVLNNREAQLQIGDQVPVAVQSAISTGSPGAPIVNSVEFRDTGVILRVTPRVNKSGLVIMDIAQEISDVVPTTSSGIDSPTIQQRKITSSVAVHSGETIALGGLIRDRKSKSRSGVPFLAKIPGLGALFRSTDDTKGRTELIILITPRVIRDGNELDGVMDDLREEFKKLRVSIPSPTGTTH
jgi:general secretion pathway protein D